MQSGIENDGSWRFLGDGAVVERECLLFEAGDYPDRGVTVTPDDLRQIARNTPVTIPVKVEHLGESPFDGALGVVTRVRAIGSQLWGTLRQPVEAWRFVQKAGARALSVALDVAGRRLVETSFVCRPRIPAAQVFGALTPRPPLPNLGEGETAVFHSEAVFGLDDESDDRRWTIDDGPDGGTPGRGDAEIYASRITDQSDVIVNRPSSIVSTMKETRMTNVRQFADGLMQYVRSALGSEGSAEDGAGDLLAQERAELEAQRELVRRQKVEQQIAEFKRQGLMRATPEAEDLARAILGFGNANLVQFNGAEAPLGALFTRFLRENGAVVPMGEVAKVDPLIGTRASDRLIRLARDKAREENVGYLAAFSQVSRTNPELARAAREEAFND